MSNREVVQGIYKLHNSINDSVYIGQSTDIETRFKTHMYELKSNKHHSYKLQEFYNKHKTKKSFYVGYHVIETVKNTKHLDYREKHYIEIYNSHDKGFNAIGLNGSRTHTKDYVKQEKKIKTLITETNEYNRLMLKYGENVSKDDYSDTAMNKVNLAIKYFAKNYSMDSYVATVRQYRSEIRLTVDHIHSRRRSVYLYNKQYNTFIASGYFYNMKTPSDTPRSSKFSNASKSKRRYVWLMKRLSLLDESVTCYSTVKYAKDYYSIPIKKIKSVIGYDGDNFKKDILDSEIYEITNKLGMVYDRGKLTLRVNEKKRGG